MECEEWRVELNRLHIKKAAHRKNGVQPLLYLLSEFEVQSIIYAADTIIPLFTC